jgi:hypothetical protein
MIPANPPTTTEDTPAGGVVVWGISSPENESADNLKIRKDTISGAKINYFICPSGNNSASKSGPGGFVASYVGIGGGTPFKANGTAPNGNDTLYPVGGSLTVTATTGTAPNTKVTTTTTAASFADVTLQNGALLVGKRGKLNAPDGTSNTIVFGEIGWNVERSTTEGPGDATGQLGAWYQGSAISDDAVTSYYSKVVTLFDTVKGADREIAVIAGVIDPDNTGGTGSKIITTKREHGELSWDETDDQGKVTTAKGTVYKSASNAGSFGSQHPAVAVFGLGDGSVRGITDSIGDNIICNFAVVDDGVAVSLP